MKSTRRKKINRGRRVFLIRTLMFMILLVIFSFKSKIFFYFDKVVADNLPKDDLQKDNIVDVDVENEDDIINMDVEGKDDINKNGSSDYLEGNLNNENQYVNDSKQLVENTDDILILVNKKKYLDSNYKPNDLVVPNVKFSFDGENEKKYMRKEAAEALEELFGQAYKERVFIFALSGYRSYNTQERLFNNRANKVGEEEEANELSARPGESEHQTGLAMDITSQSVGFDLKEKFGDTMEGEWVKHNAHDFGFIIRYPKDKTNITGYGYEPWHIRYVGKDVAEEIYNKGIVLEEYFK